MHQETRQAGVEALSPDINHSRRDFSVEGSKVRSGLAAITDVEKGLARDIIKIRGHCRVRKNLILKISNLGVPSGALRLFLFKFGT